MVLYTIVQYDDIFPTTEEANKLITYEGKNCFVQQNDDGTYKMIQLLSTDPQDFLRTEFTPGQIINKNEQ